jgi:Tyrosyl-DNA phosphodiesterase
MYIQDFPRSTHHAPNQLPQFAQDLMFFLRGQSVPQRILDKFREYSFEKSRGIEFVHSMSGEHFTNLERHAKNGLATAIRRLVFQPSQNDILELGYVVKLSLTQL